MEVIKSAAKLGVGAQRVVAITNGKTSHTYAQLLRSAWELSTKLHIKHDENSRNEAPSEVSKKSIGKDGARVGIMAVPCAEFVAGMWGTWLSGGVAVPLALSYPEAELMHVITDANITTVITTDDHRSLVESVSEKCSARLFIMPSMPSFEEENQNGVLDTRKAYESVLREVSPVLECEDKQAGLIIYTSGTTGKPKGAVHTQGGMAAQVAMLSNAWGYNAQDRFLHCLPLHHVHGLFNVLLAPLYAGASVYFMPKFSVRGVWQYWRESYPLREPRPENPITCFTGVPTMYTRLLQLYESMNPEPREAFASAARQLRLMMCGSSALPLPVMTQWEKITGHRLLERYGMTEFGMGLSNPLHGERKPGSVGKPLPGVKIKLLQDENSDPNTGELCIQSPSMFREYWNQPTVTAESFGSDGFFKTGDFVRVGDDGYVEILGRTSVDIIKSGGYKLSALEIESVLLENPKIFECAVLGIPDKDYGEVISAVITLNREVCSDLPVPEFRGWALERMAPYKVPKRLHIWKTLPRNAMGKVNKKELKQLLLAVKTPAGQEPHD